MNKSKAKNKFKVRTSARSGSKAAKSKKLKITLAAVALLVAAVGGFLIYRSFAATGDRVNITTNCRASREVLRNERYGVRVTRISYNRTGAMVSNSTKNETRRAPRSNKRGQKFTVCTNEIIEKRVIQNNLANPKSNQNKKKR